MGRVQRHVAMVTDTWRARRRLFNSPRDADRYARLLRSERGESEVVIHVRAIGGQPLFCRPGTSDADVLWDTFVGAYHLPPVAVRPGSTIVDLGANVGYTMAHLGYIAPDARLIGVEMDADNVALARRNVAHLGSRATVIHAAVWGDQAGLSHLEYDLSAASWGFRAEVPDAAASAPRAGAMKVRAVTLDSLFGEHDVGTVEYLKMDVEGAEGPILGSAGGWTRHVRSMKIEVHEPVSVNDCCRLLQQIGFSARRDSRHPSCVVAIRHDEPSSVGWLRCR
jgi:FkbM family methyltransferase